VFRPNGRQASRDQRHLRNVVAATVPAAAIVHRDGIQVGFAGGCVPPLNIPLGLTMAPECAAVGANGAPAWLVAGLVPGASRDVSAPTQPGTYNYMCLIHPWMRTTVSVRN
jgi:hypothetical protein